MHKPYLLKALCQTIRSIGSRFLNHAWAGRGGEGRGAGGRDSWADSFILSLDLMPEASSVTKGKTMSKPFT